MGDDRPADFTCEMPSFISTIEEGKVKLSRHLPAETTEVERSVTDLHPNTTRSNSTITLNGEANQSERKIGWEEEQRSTAEEKDSDSDGVAEIFSQNCGTISQSTLLNVNNNSRVEYDRENDVDNANNDPITERHFECGDCENSNRETGQEMMKSDQSFCKTSGLTTQDKCEVDFLTDPGKCYYNRGRVSSKTTSQDAEHVYCTVYCVANDFGGKAVEISEGYIETPTSIESEDSFMETMSETGSGPEPYSLSDLVDPRVMGPRSGDPGVVVVVLNCRVCLDDKAIAPLHCCQIAVCDECLKRYISSELLMGKAHIPCPTLECSGFLEEGLVVSNLAKEDVAKYHYLVELSQMDVNNKPCPKCSLFTALKTLTPLRAENKYKIQCSDCQFVWCFKCHAPWHNGLKCREYRKGDKLFRNWANDVAYGQRNAQKCPQCKIHIQRTEGCDHMTCTQCNTNFCYRCGERYRHLRFFGDHTSNLSVFGCKYRYLPEKPHLRRLVRGSVCVGKMVIAPVAIVLLLVLGAISLVIGLVALPVYYVCKKKKKQLPYWYW